jgi:transposase
VVEDTQSILRLGERLLRQQMTIQQIMEHCEIAERTAYRWVDTLERRGWDVVRARNPVGGFAFRALSREPSKL